jgi:hypothetical protein
MPVASTGFEGLYGRRKHITGKARALRCGVFEDIEAVMPSALVHLLLITYPQALSSQ